MLSTVVTDVFHPHRHFFGSINLGATNEVLRASILLTADMASQLGLDSPWEGNVDEYRFLDRVLG